MDLVQTPSPAPSGTPVDQTALAARPRRVKGLVIEVMESLAGSIRSGAIKPGEKLPTESEIVARFDVSRTVVREAISRLQANRLVETRHGVGTFALPPEDTKNFKIADVDFATVADVIALLELRISLETEAAGLAAQRRTDQNLQAMQAMLDAFVIAIEEDSDAVPSDFNFHMEVARHRQPPFRRPHDLPGHHDHSAHPGQHPKQRTGRPSGLLAPGAQRAREHLQRHPQPGHRCRPRRHAHPPGQQQRPAQESQAQLTKLYDD